MLKRKQQKSLNHERFNSLVTKSKTYRPLFTDVEAFDDLYARNTDVEMVDDEKNSSNKIIKKPSKLTVIEPTFVNFLHQLTPDNKIIYNDIKNLLLSYENITFTMDKYTEIFKINRKNQIIIKFVGPYVQVCYKKVNYNIDTRKKFNLFVDELQLIMKTNNINKVENYQIVDYVIDYPQLENCIIMDEDIVGNLPFKELKK